jgi:hypothetical protein
MRKADQLSTCRFDRPYDPQCVSVHVNAKRDKARGKDRVNGHRGDEQQKVKPIRKIREQDKGREKGHLDKGGHDECDLVIALGLLDLFECVRSNLVYIVSHLITPQFLKNIAYSSSGMRTSASIAAAM